MNIQKLTSEQLNLAVLPVEEVMFENIDSENIYCNNSVSENPDFIKNKLYCYIMDD